MSTTFTRRQMMALAGLGAVGVSGVARAQSAPTSYTFANGNELVWADPWFKLPTEAVSVFLADATMLISGIDAQLLVGYYDEAKTVDDAANDMFSGMFGTAPHPTNLAGGSDQTTVDGVSQTQEYGIYLINTPEQQTAYFFLLTNGQELKVIYGAPAILGEAVATVQAAVTLNGDPVFADIESADIGDVIALAIASDGVTFAEYADALDILHVQYESSWKVISQNEAGIELADPAEPMVFSAQTFKWESGTPEDLFEHVFDFYTQDQGPDVVASTMVVKDGVMEVATDGEYGLRLLQVTPSTSPEHFIVILARDFEQKGTEAVAVLEQMQAATLVNGEKPLPGLEAHIMEIAPA